MKQQKHQQIRNQSQIDDRLANYINVLRGLRESQGTPVAQTPLDISSTCQDLSEITMNTAAYCKPVLMNSEEQINRYNKKELCNSNSSIKAPQITGSFADAVRMSMPSACQQLQNSSQPLTKL